MATGTIGFGPGQKKLRSFAGLALFVVAACGGTTRQNATTANGGTSGSDGRAGAGEATAGKSAGETDGAGGTSTAGAAIDLGGAGSSAVAGSAGSASSAGATAGQGGVGGVAGSANLGGIEGCPFGFCTDEVTSKVSDFGFTAWKSSWFLTGCQARDGASCATIVGACPKQAAAFEQQGAQTLESFEIGGKPGQRYKVSFAFDGLVEAKEYEGGTRDAGNGVPPNADNGIWDTFHRDGTPTPSGANVWELSVYDHKQQLARRYYMNSFPKGQGWESQRLFNVSFTKSIVIVGGGKLTHRVQDPDCRSVDNCGSGNVPPDTCPAPRTLSKAPTTQLPAQYQDPSDGLIKPTLALSPMNKDFTQPWHSQLGHLTVTKVEETTDPVTTDYL